MTGLEIASLIISCVSLAAVILLFTIGYIKYNSILINLYSMSKGLDTLFSNQEKTLELAKIKSFVKHVHEEETRIKQEIDQEKLRTTKETEGVVRSSDGD
jgi:hypothetical protein